MNENEISGNRASQEFISAYLHTSPRLHKYKLEAEKTNPEETCKSEAYSSFENIPIGNNSIDTASTGIRNTFSSKTAQLADENAALKTQLNNLLRDNGDLWEQKLELMGQVTVLTSSNMSLNTEVVELRSELIQAVEAKQALEKRSYTLNELLDVSAESQLILKTETETLSSDLSKCRMQKSTIMEQLAVTLQEVSIQGTELSLVKEKNYHLLQQLANITYPSPSEVIKSLMYYNNANSPPPYFLLHQFRKLSQKRQLLEAALAVPDPTILRDVLVIIQAGLSDPAFADLLELFPEAKNMYISHMTSLGLHAWPTLLRIFPYLKMPYEEGMLKLKIAMMDPDPMGRQLGLKHCMYFFAEHECLQWEREQLDTYMKQIYSD